MCLSFKITHLENEEGGGRGTVWSVRAVKKNAANNIQAIAMWSLGASTCRAKPSLLILRLGIGRNASRNTVDTARCFMVLVSSGSSY